MFFCCVLSGRGLCDELITRLEVSYRPWRVVVCLFKKPRERIGHSPRWTAEPEKIIINNNSHSKTSGMNSSPWSVSNIQYSQCIPQMKVLFLRF
jgi:hypothetical protein